MGACTDELSPSNDAGTGGLTGLTAQGSSTTQVGDETSEERLDIPADTEGVGPTAEGGNGCVADLVGTELRPVFLGVAFDVSGSMGELDEPWHDPELKWEPVVAATKAFFTDPTSSGLTATMTFFPSEEDRCEDDSYVPPDVAPTMLPSMVFVDAIDAVTPQSPDQWRGGTPTLAVSRATLAMLQPMAADDPVARYVYVLISDGYPQGCGDDNDINLTIEAVADVSADITTYVIGVQNPPGGPESVENLDAIAVAGGSEAAFIVQTGDPEQTAADFAAAIEAIRTSSISCILPIPEPPNGASLEPDEVNVRFNGELLGYDPDCADPRGWRYDDPVMPTQIEICPAVCDEVKEDPDRDLVVEFGCQTQPAG
ncbi:MAG: vWA domain-containing protein [Myxococcota bacterium]